MLLPGPGETTENAERYLREHPEINGALITKRQKQDVSSSPTCSARNDADHEQVQELSATERHRRAARRMLPR